MGIMMIAGTERRRQGCSLQDGKQWGLSTGQADLTTILPFPMTESFISLCCANSYWTNAGCDVSNTAITLSQAQTDKASTRHYGPLCWIVLGKQTQWGLGNPSINFPIAFPKECFIAAITRAAGNYEHSIVITTKNKTNLSWICKGYDNSAGNTYANWLALGCQLQWGYYTAAVGAIYTDVTTPVSFSRCFLAASIDILLAASTTWPGTTQTVWNINASTANKLRFIWAKAPIELDGAVWFGIFIQTVGNNLKQ